MPPKRAIRGDSRKGLSKSATLLEAVDFDENFDRAEKSETNIRKLFEGTVGSGKIVELLEGYQETVRAMKSYGLDPKESVPFTFLFRGPPGTGKTTTARKMGKVYYDMGFLATAELIECSATDLIGSYVGQTGPKVQDLLDRALGRVLVIDEAYRLADGNFAKEAIDELVDSVTKPRYYQKLVIILAGYERDINQLMSINPGLTSRFPEVIDFQALSPLECVVLLTNVLKETKARLAGNAGNFDLTALERPTEPFMESLLMSFSELSLQEGWASARDVVTLAKGIFSKTLRKKPASGSVKKMKVEESMVISEVQGMLEERANRSRSANVSDIFAYPGLHQFPPAEVAALWLPEMLIRRVSHHQTQLRRKPKPLRTHILRLQRRSRSRRPRNR